MTAASEANPSLQVDSPGYDATGHQKNVLIRLSNIQTDTGVTPNVTYGDVAIDTGGAAGFVALTSPPATTNVGTDTPLTFSAQVNHYRVQNNTSANVNIKEDATSSAGTLVLLPGALYREDKQLTVLHLLTAAAQNINGSTAGNILVEGWL